MRCPCLSFSGFASVVCWLAPALAVAAQLPDRFTLGRYVPEDAWLFIHGVDNPERKWIDDQWAGVVEAFKSSGIDRDIMALVMSALPDEGRTQVESAIQKTTTLLQGVRWGDLVHREFVFVERLAPNKRGYDYLVLVHGAEKSGEANIAGLLAILKELTSLIPGGMTTQSKLHDVDLWTLQVKLPEAKEGGETKESKDLPLSVDLFRKGDIIGLAVNVSPGHAASGGTRTVEEVIGLMAGQSAKRAIVASPRFQSALADVATPQDALVFFDIKMLLADLSRMCDSASCLVSRVRPKAAIKADPAQAEAQAPRGEPKKDEAGDQPSGTKELGLVKKIIGLCDVFDYSITTTETRGRRELTHNVTRLQLDKKNCPLADVCLKRKPFERFDQYIPADATGFSLTGLLDVAQLYQMALDFISKELPEGPGYITQWKEGLSTIGFDPQKDLFEWWSGEMISVTLPATVVSPMSGADKVWMIRVKNRELASAKINAVLDLARGKIQNQGQMLLVSPAKVNAEGFQEITHPMFAMFLRPVVGVQGEWLMIGSSAAAINKCLDVSAGKTPSIAKNERFKTEGLVPTGPVTSASFTDTSKFGQELGAAIGMVGMFGGMAAAGIPENSPQARKAKQAVQSALSIVMKLGPILQKIDFYSSESSISTYDGNTLMRTESVVTYRASSPNEVTAVKLPEPPTPPRPPQ